MYIYLFSLKAILSRSFHWPTFAAKKIKSSGFCAALVGLFLAGFCFLVLPTVFHVFFFFHWRAQILLAVLTHGMCLGFSKPQNAVEFTEFWLAPQSHQTCKVRCALFGFLEAVTASICDPWPLTALLHSSHVGWTTSNDPRSSANRKSLIRHVRTLCTTFLLQILNSKIPTQKCMNHTSLLHSKCHCMLRKIWFG